MKKKMNMENVFGYFKAENQMSFLKVEIFSSNSTKMMNYFYEFHL